MKNRLWKYAIALLAVCLTGCFVEAGAESKQENVQNTIKVTQEHTSAGGADKNATDDSLQVTDDIQDVIAATIESVDETKQNYFPCLKRLHGMILR